MKKIRHKNPESEGMAEIGRKMQGSADQGGNDTDNRLEHFQSAPFSPWSNAVPSSGLAAPLPQPAQVPPGAPCGIQGDHYGGASRGTPALLHAALSQDANPCKHGLHGHSLFDWMLVGSPSRTLCGQSRSDWVATHHHFLSGGQSPAALGGASDKTLHSKLMRHERDVCVAFCPACVWET